ncbi:MAG: iron-sulfur cluster assembly scaffold protein [Alphaproteobacteria bacterium]|nr:iron-sulfur cluster assembly scaffold protein [Alphaproteobacteria bacterium]
MNDDLYQKAILGKAREATGAGTMEEPDAHVTVDNPVCGDRVTMEIRLSDNGVAAVAHKVRGCLLCEAAASVIGANAPGATRAEIAAAREAVTALIEDGVEIPADGWSELSIFQPVTAHKSRYNCVLLPFEALSRALKAADTAD